ncbi:MAG: phosphocholine cytidylyltransferase family protein [Planctomycetes bacterium]|nr:phosphocholine cytidylyltransferase family protein [Planctomycetota bacterium]
MATVRQAMILGAGMGVRLKELGQHTPKGFLRLGARPIVEEALERLAAVGIERVVIATGHHAELYEDLARRNPGFVRTVHNARYADSGSLYSLWCARAELPEDFLLLESDLIYERRALREALEHPSPDVLLVSAPTDARDEVWVEARDGCLVDMSKDRAALGSAIAGELVGITKVSRPFFAEMLRVGERLFRETLKVDYELEGLVQAARARPLPVHLVPDLVWAEIDDLHHLERARTSVYPELLRRDALSSAR